MSGVDLEGLCRRAVEASGGGGRWSVDAGEMWCRLTPGSGVGRRQGWKLHVSATSVSAPEVLVRSLDVLLREESGFKFVRSLEQVGALNSRATPRGSSGKFITVYPVSDEAAARVALALHEATAGLAGPRILSDQPYAPQSLVHYRYGAFVGRRRVSEQGLLVWFIEDPDGNPVEDRRTGRYAPPAWAVSPFPAAVPAPAVRPVEPKGPVVLGGRFSVREAIRHTNKGGVYRGMDVTTSAPVVIKEARPHVEGDVAGSDVRDWLRAEARILEKLKHTGLAPEPLAVFEIGGHLFLAQEEVPGVPLRTWVAERFRDVGGERYRVEALAQVGRLVDLVAAAHACGCVLRDFTPGNVMVRPDGELRLIDLELAVLTDEVMLPTRVGTPGFSAPERLEDAAVSATADYYSLGATVCFVLAGKVPQLLPEEPDTRATEERFQQWLAACAPMLRLPAGLQEMILNLMKDDPGQRWDPDTAREALHRVLPPHAATPSPPGTATPLPGHGAQLPGHESGLPVNGTAQLPHGTELPGHGSGRPGRGTAQPSHGTRALSGDGAGPERRQTAQPGRGIAPPSHGTEIPLPGQESGLPGQGAARSSHGTAQPGQGTVTALSSHGTAQPGQGTVTALSSHGTAQPGQGTVTVPSSHGTEALPGRATGLPGHGTGLPGDGADLSGDGADPGRRGSGLSGDGAALEQRGSGLPGDGAD
ncbi:class IV lanthionine synthetase LanL, partial [Streptomyces collinus]|uniref:class IV lanthionine synthetase LanL n=1 Tax=Streptomyces collinus TaxID=42684 RepID=UPI00362FAFA2